jgi:hypothetical protein
MLHDDQGRPISETARWFMFFRLACKIAGDPPDLVAFHLKFMHDELFKDVDGPSVDRPVTEPTVAVKALLSILVMNHDDPEQARRFRDAIERSGAIQKAENVVDLLAR